jgi:outer membrane receptor protein involved in Fe transport
MKFFVHRAGFICLILFFFYAVIASGFAAESVSDINEKPNAALQRFELDDVVVTATRGESAVDMIPKNVTVITAEEIAQSPAGNIVDLLGREAGLNIRSFTGNEGKSGVDIRGMGDTYVSNVIVMVDGFRLNASDMSGADFLSVPLGEVEKIEIVRGGGSVLYGDGAVGGVINIITKKNKKKKAAKISSRVGSYGTHEERAHVGGQSDLFSFNVSGGYSESSGYRDNGGLRKKDAALKMGLDISDTSHMGIELSYLDSKIGFPGPVAHEDLFSEEKRRLTTSPEDFSETIDKRIMGTFEIDTPVGSFTLKGGYRDRDNPYILGYTPLLPEADQTDEITEDTMQLSLGHEYTLSFNRVKNTSRLGLDFYDTGYQREDKDNERKHGEIRKIEGFFFDELALTKGLTFSGGYRYSMYTGKFREDTYTDFYSPAVFPPPVFIPPQYLYSIWETGTPYEKQWNNHAYEIGVAWKIAEPVTVFAGHSKSFRIPNTDEFILADSDLHPQTSMHFDGGVRLRAGRTAELSCTLFQIITSDEIYYGEDPVTHATFNRNYDEKTNRKGMEIQFKFYPVDFLYLWGNYSYTQAKFETSDTYIPLVPRHMANIGVEVYLFDSFTFAFTGTMAGACYDGNDPSNEDEDNQLASYKVFDMKLTWRKDNFQIFAGIQNMFNELYVTSAYSGSGYPMPERSLFCGADWRF